MGQNRQIRSFFETLRNAWGAQYWWPAESAFEVIVGAILTQNTAWTNVEKALVNLRAAKALSVTVIRKIPVRNLEKLVQPAGFFRQKAARLKRFVEWLDQRHGGSLQRMFARPTEELRTELLNLNGIGPETADSILLYAGQHEVFVVDAYTRRILERHRVVRPEAKYDDIRRIIERALQTPRVTSEVAESPLPTNEGEPGPRPPEETVIPRVHVPSTMSVAPRSSLAQDFNEFHALIVQVGKHYCLSRLARCEQCPLGVYLHRPVVFSKSKRRGQRTKRNG